MKRYYYPESQRRYYLKNKDKIMERKKDTEKIYRSGTKYKEWVREYMKTNQKKKRLELLILVGGIKCKRCGFNDWRALQVDHINAGGMGEKHITNSVYKYIKQVRLHPEKYQVLCANCNWIKRYENNESSLRFKSL